MLPVRHRLIAGWLVVSGLMLVGCGPDRQLHSVSGSVTLGGKGYERLLVYFRPVDRVPDETCLGVGETDASGRLTLRSTAGDGLAKGNYRVSFSCAYMQGSRTTVADPTGEKGDDTATREEFTVVERVPELYTDAEQSPVTFEIVPGGDNQFVFDIPAS